MSAFQEIENFLSQMSRAEKARLLQMVARDLGDEFPGIESSPDVCGGEPRITTEAELHVALFFDRFYPEPKKG